MKLLNVPPGFAPDRAMHTGQADPELGGQCRLGLPEFVASPALQNDLSGQHGPWIALTTAMRVVTQLVRHIFRLRTPAQVDQPIATTPSWTVQRFLALGARAGEGFEYEPVNELAILRAVLVQGNLAIARTSHREAEKPAMPVPAGSVKPVKTAHPAEVRDLIETFISGDGKPALGRICHSRTSIAVRPRRCVDPHGGAAASHFTGRRT
jgi:hypothetical protein